MFSPYEVLAIVHSRRLAVVVSGLASGIVFSAIPPVSLLLNTSIMAVWLLTRGSSLMEMAHNESLLNCMKLASTYYIRGYPFVMTFCAYCTLQAILSRYFLGRGKSRDIKIWAPGGLCVSEVTVRSDALLPIALVPILIPLISINLARVLALACGMLFISGAVFTLCGPGSLGDS